MYNQIASNKRKTILLIAIFTAVIVGSAGFELLFRLRPWSVVGALVFRHSCRSLAITMLTKIASGQPAPRKFAKEQPLCLPDGGKSRDCERHAYAAVHVIGSPALNAFATGRDQNTPRSRSDRPRERP